MKAPAIHPAGRCGLALTMRRRGRVLLGALLLALTPGLSSAGATELKEWPTAADDGPRASTKKIPWLRFSGDPSAPVLAMAPGQAVHSHEVLVVREQELTRRQRRLLRRAERREQKAAELRARANVHGQRSAYAVVVPVVQTTPKPPPAPPAPPTPMVYRPEPPRVHVVRLDREHEHDGCHHDDEQAKLEAEVDALAVELEELEHERPPVEIDVERLSADVERQVERALRDADRAMQRAERDRQRAERDAQRAERDAQRAAKRSRR